MSHFTNNIFKYIFLAAAKQLYEWFIQSACPSDHGRNVTHMESNKIKGAVHFGVITVSLQLFVDLKAKIKRFRFVIESPDLLRSMQFDHKQLGCFANINVY